jgi:hypothetical protein
MADCPTREDGPVFKLLEPANLKENNVITFNILDIVT